MNDNATIFSQSRTIVFDKPVARNQIEGLLKKCAGDIGGQLSYDKVILGHIKMLAYLSSKEDFVFLSLTAVDRIDVQFSPRWNASETEVDKVELDINVLLFGHSLEKVKSAVDSSLRELKY